MVFAQGEYAIVAQKLGGVEHAFEQLLHMMTSYQSQQGALTGNCQMPVRYQPREVGPVGQKPGQVIFKPRQGIEHMWFDGLHIAIIGMQNVGKTMQGIEHMWFDGLHRA